MNTYFVVRATNHPEEDIKRNWSAVIGGGPDGAFDSAESAIEYYRNQGYDEMSLSRMEFRFHPAYNGFVEVHYEGLGAEVLDAQNLEDALKEALNYDEYLACQSESGSGHFQGYDCVSFHKAKDGIYVFEIK